MIATNTVTFAGTTNLLTMGTPVIAFNHLTIGINSSLTAWPGLITVNGNFTNNGTFHHRGGTIVFAGSMAKRITCVATTEFENLTIQNGTAETDVTVEGHVTLAGLLMLAPGAHFDADGAADTSVFLLRSVGDNPTADACIGILPEGAQVLGKVTVQRYLATEGGNNHRIYRYVSAPVSNATVSDLQNEIPVTGAFIGSSSCQGCGGQPSMFWYDESVVTGGVGDGYVPFPSASNSEVFVPGRGYALFVRGNIDPVLVAGTSSFDLTGPINSGIVDYHVTYNSSGLPDNDGWNLVGNPYPAPINWDAAEGWTKGNVSGAIYRMDNGEVPNRYAVWNGTVGINGGSATIPAGQGFFVQTTEGEPVLRSDERVKDPGATARYFRTAAPRQLLRIGLLQGIRKDETIIHFREGASEVFDIRCDARKLKNLLDGNADTPFLNLSSLAAPNRLRLAINSLPDTIHETMVRLDVSDVPVGSYSLEFSNVESFSSETVIILTDKFLLPHRAVDLRRTGSYPFQVTNDSLSFGADRFTIHFSNPQTVTGGIRNSPEGKFYPNPVSGDFFAEIEDEANELTSLRIVNSGGEEIGKLTTVRNGKDVMGQFDFTSSPCGVYFLEVVRGRNRRWEKIVRK